jgi:hypothetical protein
VHQAARDPPDSPVVDRFVRGEQDEVQPLEDIAFLDLPAQQERDGIVEGVQRELEHELVRGRQRADEDEVEVGAGFSQDEVRR